MFENRRDAGRRLAEALLAYRLPAQAGGKDAVVVGLPRGGVAVAAEVARILGLPLDIIAVRKIGHPGAPEYALGAVDETGERFLNEADAASIDPAWIEREADEQMRVAKRRLARYRGDYALLQVRGKVAIIVDDGIATGYTMRLAVRRAKKQGAAKVIAAVPVAPLDAVSALESEGAEVVVLEPPENFLGAVGAHYIDFPQLTDAQVISLLGGTENTV